MLVPEVKILAREADRDHKTKSIIICIVHMTFLAVILPF